MREKAQSTWEPKAMGVKMIRRMRRISITISNFEVRISDFGTKFISDFEFKPTKAFRISDLVFKYGL